MHACWTPVTSCFLIFKGSQFSGCAEFEVSAFSVNALAERRALITTTGLYKMYVCQGPVCSYSHKARTRVSFIHNAMFCRSTVFP